MKTITLKIVGMHCVSCAINIDFELEDLEGVQEAKTHYAKQLSMVTFDPQKIALGKITETIQSLGYSIEPLPDEAVVE